MAGTAIPRPGIRFALLMAGRELRGGFRSGLRGFRIFFACLVLGVAAIAGIGSLAASVTTAIHDDARLLLGGDVALSLPNRGISAAQLDWLQKWGRVSESREQRAMLRNLDQSRSAVVELRAVDRAYPLYGAVQLQPALSLGEALRAGPDGVAGIVLDPILLKELNLGIGDKLLLGTATFVIRATIQKTPDGGGNFFSLGAPAYVRLAALGPAGLNLPGTIATFQWCIKLAGNQTAEAFRTAAVKAFPTESWRIKDPSNASPGLQGVIDHVAGFLSLVALTALLVGGIGVANAVSAHLASRSRTIAILKSVGASSPLIFAIYLLEILGMAVLAILIGLALGATLPSIAQHFIGDRLPIALETGLHEKPLALATAFGLLTSLIFSLQPLLASRNIAAADLLRHAATEPIRFPSKTDLAILAVPVMVLEGLVLATAADLKLAQWFSLGAAALLGVFRLVAYLLLSAAKRLPSIHDVALRQAIANLHRKGSPTGAVITSLGLGLTVLVAIASVQHTLDREVSGRLPAKAPSVFFIDIQPDQLDDFTRLVTSTPGITDLHQLPNLRTRITAINGIPTERARIDPSARSLVDSERGLTYSAALPPASQVVAGQWWPETYHGAPAISLDESFAKNLHLKIGDSLTFDIAGREITAVVASLRKIDWSSLSINFFTIFAPGVLEPAPQTHIATIVARDDSAEAALQRQVIAKFPNVSAIRVKEALQRVTSILSTIATAIRAVASITLISGILVLAGAVAAGRRRHAHDAVILKVLGAPRTLLIRSLAWQYGILGMVIAIIGGFLGALTAWAVSTYALQYEWVAAPLRLGATALSGAILVIILGIGGTWRALSVRPALFLREE